MGRYIWSNSPFYAEITEKQIAITSNFEKINIYQAEHTLKEAYEDDLGKITIDVFLLGSFILNR